MLERVWDQIQRKYFCERVFRLHQDTTRRDTLEWMTDSTRYTLTDKFCLYLVAQQIDPWSMMSEVWEGEQIAKEYQRDGHITESGACGFTSIDKAAVSAC